jgi:hypothetical protein
MSCNPDTRRLAELSLDALRAGDHDMFYARITALSDLDPPAVSLDLDDIERGVAPEPPPTLEELDREAGD